jgi:peptidoglycan/xylan/chitin deacetylase (PgdA/CDA1 family)
MVMVGNLTRKVSRALARKVSRALARMVGIPSGILAYHRVAELEFDPQLLAVTRKHFAEQLQVLREAYRPMSLQDWVASLKHGTLPPRAVAVTFDDGYADNLYDAKPLLERHDIPASVFVTTDYLGKDREFWWDELERVLLQPGIVPEMLRISINGDTYQWELDEAAYYSEDVYKHHRCWNVQEDDPSRRHRLYRSLCRLLRLLPESERRKALDELLTWASADPTSRPTHRILAPDELVRLAEGGLVEVGAHTQTHSVLSALPVVMQKSEIMGSKACLEEILGHPVTSFAYPFGSRSDYARETVAILRDAGFTYACSNFGDVVWRGTDRFQLPRVLVRDWDGNEFSERLQRWFRG